MSGFHAFQSVHAVECSAVLHIVLYLVFDIHIVFYMLLVCYSLCATPCVQCLIAAICAVI